MQQYTILDSHWWNTTDTLIGAVAVQTGENEWKGYIGTASGLDIKRDEQAVARDGAGLQPEEAHVFFPRLQIGRYKDYKPAQPLSGEEPEGDVKSEQVRAMITHISYGLPRWSKSQQPALWFRTEQKDARYLYTEQLFEGEEATKFIVENNIHDIFDLNERECVVRLEGNTMQFVHLV